MNKLLVLLTVCLLISACETSQQQRDAYTTSLNSHVGENIAAVIDRMGYADSLSESAAGNRVFVYSRYHVSNSSISCSRDKQNNVSCSGGDVREHWCKTYFEVDDDNTIIRTSFQGNECGNCSSRIGGFCMN